MKKILVACRGYYPDVAGGGEISTKSLSEQLLNIGHQVEVLAVSNSDYKDQINDVIINRVKYANVYWSMEKEGASKAKKIAWHIVDSNNFFFANKVSKILDEFKPDILITSTIEDISSLVWKVAKKKGIRVIHILRSYSLLCTNANMYKEDNCGSQCGFCKGMTLLKRVNSKYVDDVVGISDFVLNEHTKNEYFCNANKHVIYNICLEDILSKRVYDGFKTREIKIGYLGRIHKTKGIDLIFNALKILPYEITKSLELKIAGGGDENYISHLTDDAIRKRLNVDFLGNVPANDFLDGLDLLIVPSKWNEPFGRVIIESMARKVPVAAKRSGGIPELLSCNQGFLFDDIEQLSSIIRNYIEGQLIFEFNLNEFKTENILSKWTSLLV